MNHKNNPSPDTEARFMQQTVAVFDQAPVGIVQSSVSQICRLADLASVASMHHGFVRGQDECLQFCDDLAEPYPATAQLCLMNIETIKVYQSNQFSRSVLPAPVIPMEAKIAADLPAAFTAGACEKIHIGFKDRLNQPFSATGQKISLKYVGYKTATGSGVLYNLYPDSTCSGITLLINPAINGSTGMDAYLSSSDGGLIDENPTSQLHSRLFRL